MRRRMFVLHPIFIDATPWIPSLCGVEIASAAAGPLKVNRSIVKWSLMCAARRWLLCNPLFAHAMRVEDAWAA